MQCIKFPLYYFTVVKKRKRYRAFVNVDLSSHISINTSIPFLGNQEL